MNKTFWVHDNFLHVREDLDRLPVEVRRAYSPTVQRRTVGFRANRENGTVEYAYSICHPGDIFSKKLGRTIVAGRFESEDYFVANSFADVQRVIGDSVEDNFDSNMTSLQHAFNSCYNSLNLQVN